MKKIEFKKKKNIQYFSYFKFGFPLSLVMPDSENKNKKMMADETSHLTSHYDDDERQEAEKAERHSGPTLRLKQKKKIKRQNIKCYFRPWPPPFVLNTFQYCTQTMNQEQTGEERAGTAHQMNRKNE